MGGLLSNAPLHDQNLAIERLEGRSRVGLVSVLEINNDRPTDNQELISLAHSAGCRVEFLFESKKNKVHSS